MPFAAALVTAQAAAARVPPIQVDLTAPDGSRYTTASGRFQQGASTELVLFIFLTSMTGAAFMIETRRLGIARRILSTPTSTRTIVTGQLLGRLSVALLQALIIVAGSMLLFGVTWGDPLATGVVILSFSLVGTGVAIARRQHVQDRAAGNADRVLARARTRGARRFDGPARGVPSHRPDDRARHPPRLGE